MNVQVLGCSHHSASLELRERLAFAPEQTRVALFRLRQDYPSLQAVLLSTCNRVELYTATENGGAPTPRQLAEFFANFHQIDPNEVIEHLYDRDGRESVRHLFLVASSLDSMVVGEPQITSQVKMAYQLATEQKAAGPLIHAMFQAAAKVARRVANETAIHERRVSIPSVAVGDFAKQIFQRFDDKKTLVIGAGEMAEETLCYLRDEGVREITVVNRNAQRGFELAERHHGRAVDWLRLLDELAGADVVVSTTGASQPIVTLDQFQSIEPVRQGRTLFVLDLAVPRDFDPPIGDRPGVYLYSVDDLQAACEQNRRERERELPAALRIIERETDRFMSELHRRAVGPVIERVRRSWEQPKEHELQRLFNKLPDLDERARSEIRRSFDRLTNKLFHPPMESLREESRNGTPTGLVSALVKLFQLKD
jgi:glutamyl-tRNA reductase